MAWKRSGVRIPPGPPLNSIKINNLDGFQRGVENRLGHKLGTIRRPISFPLHSWSASSTTGKRRLSACVSARSGSRRRQEGRREDRQDRDRRSCLAGALRRFAAGARGFEGRLIAASAIRPRLAPYIGPSGLRLRKAWTQLGKAESSHSRTRAGTAGANGPRQSESKLLEAALFSADGTPSRHTSPSSQGINSDSQRAHLSPRSMLNGARLEGRPLALGRESGAEHFRRPGGTGLFHP